MNGKLQHDWQKLGQHKLKKIESKHIIIIIIVVDYWGPSPISVATKIKCFFFTKLSQFHILVMWKELIQTMKCKFNSGAMASRVVETGKDSLCWPNFFWNWSREVWYIALSVVVRKWT